jgi:predicted XRE-type DNA-binding protein
MQLSDATRIRIRQLLKDNNMKLWNLATAAGVSLPTISDFMKNESVSFWTRFHFFLLYKILIFI